MLDGCGAKSRAKSFKHEWPGPYVLPMISELLRNSIQTPKKSAKKLKAYPDFPPKPDYYTPVHRRRSSFFFVLSIAISYASEVY